MKQYLFLLLSLAFLACACNPVTLEPQLLTDVDGPIIINKDGGTFNIQVKANCTWKATVHLNSGVEFFSLTPDSGQADGTIQIDSRMNAMNYEKLGTIEIEYGNKEETRLHCIKVVQEPREPFMVFLSDESSDALPAYGGTAEVWFCANTPYMNCTVADTEQSESVQIRIRQIPFIEQEIIEGFIIAKIPVNTTYEARTFTLELTDLQHTTVFDTYVIHQAGRQK